MAVRQEDIQVNVSFITDESRALARTLQTTKAYNAELEQSQAKIREYNKQLAQTNITETKRVELLAKVAAEEKKVATNLAQIAAEGKKVEALDLTKVTPAQLVERAKQLNLALRNIPQSAPQFRQLQGELTAVNTRLRELNTTAKGIQTSTGGGGIFGTVFGVAGGLGVFELVRQGVRSLFTFGRQAVAEVDAQLKADAQIKEAIRSTGGVAGKSLEELKRQAEELQKVTLFGDEQTEGAQALLLTFKNIRGEIFDETVPLVQDLATAFKQDLSSSAIQVGKALEDPIRGVTALRRVGITFSEDQQRMIRSLVETGRVADAQRIILKELESQVGGSARAAAKAGAGPWQQLTLVFGELKEAVGGFLLNFGSNAIANFKNWGTAILDFVAGPQKTLKQQTEDLQVAFNNEIEVLLRGNFTQDERARLIGEINKKYKEYLPNLIDEKASLEDIAKAQRAANDEFLQKILFLKLEEKITAAQKEGQEGAEIAFQSEVKRGKLRQQERQKEVQDNAAFLEFLQKQDEALTSLREGGLQVAQETPQRISEIEKEFNELAKAFGTTVEELRKKFAPKPEGGTPDGLTGGLKKDAEAAAGSLAFLRQQISDLQGQIENTPGDSKALAPLIRQLNEAEKALQLLEDRIAALKNPPQDTPPSDDEIRRQLGIPTAEQARDLSEAARAALVEDNAFRLDQEELTLEGINQMRQELSDEDLRRIEERKQAELSIAESLSNALFEIEGNRFQQQSEQALDALDKEYAERIKAAEGNSREQARLQKELEQKKAAIEREAARKRKEIAIKEAVIQGALAVVKALPNAFAAAAAAAAAAAQIAIIASQKFARGGYTGRGYGAPDSTGFRPAGVVHEGEYVVPKRIVDDQRARPLIHYLEQKRLRGYADGGFVNTTPLPLPNLSPVGAEVFGQIETLNEAVLRFEKVVAEFPTEVKSRVVLTELETAQGELDSVRSDAAI